MVNCDQDAKFSEEEFLILMQGILGSSGEKDKKVSKSKASKHSPLPESIYPYLGKRESKESDAENLKDSFIKFIFEQISSTKDYTANNNHFNEFFGIYERLARDNNCLLGLESGLVTRFKSFLQGITVSNKRAYLVKFDNENQNIKKIFGLENSCLMNVFDIINWVTSKSLKTFDGIKEPLITFFSSPTFGDPSEQALKDSPQSMTELLRFIYAFNKADVNDLLWFFAQHHMAEEFVFVLSYCVYIGVLNNWVTPLNKGYDHFKAVSACLSYPIIQQVCSANLISNPKFKNMAGNLDQAEIQSRVAKLKASIFELRNTSFIDQIGLGDMKKKIELGGLTSLLNHNHCLEKLFTGELFKEYQKEVGLVLQSTLNPYDSEVLSKAIDRLKEVYLFRPDFAQEDLEKEVQKGSQATENLITSAYKMRQHWEGLKKHYLMEARSNARQENDSIASTILTEAENNKSLFDFMNVSSGEREQIVSFIYPTMIYMFIYLKSLKDVINPNENGARMSILRQSLNFIWKLFTTFKVRHSTNLDNIDRDPIAVLGIKDKEKKIDFLNRYAGMVYNLKIKKSNIYILKDLLRFAIKFIFYRAESKVKDKRFDELINNLKLDSFMELYDYLEEMDNSKEVSENYKENIVDMFVKFVNDPRFKKHVTDIKNIVKLAQGDMGKLHYFVDKLFTKSETASYVKNNLQSFVTTWEKAKLSKGSASLLRDVSPKEERFTLLSLEDRDTLLKRAYEGQATSAELFLLFRGRTMRNGFISYPEFEVIIRRFGLTITDHKMAELISGTKLMQAEQSVGFTKLNFSYTEESEFEKILLYIEDKTSCMARSTLNLSAANLINYSLLTFAIYIFSILIASNLATYYFQGEYLGSILSACVPLLFVVYFSRRKSAKEIPEQTQKEELNKAFELITTSKAELVI